MMAAMSVSRQPTRPPLQPPSGAESAASTIAPFVGMSADERLRAQSALVRALLAFAGDRPVLRDDEFDPLWPRWKDPCPGRRSN